MSFAYFCFIRPLLLVIYFGILTPLSNKVRRLNTLRQERRRLRPQWAQCIWFHASSGEFEYVKPVLTRLRRKHPDRPVVVTYSSSSYAENIARFPGVAHCEPLPIDLPGPLHDFFRRLNPTVLCVAKSDLWPEALRMCRQRKIPVVTFATSFAKDMGFLERVWKKFVFSSTDVCLTIREEDRQTLEALISKDSPSHLRPTIQALGDPRYDQAHERLSKASPQRLFPPSKKITLVAGSTWPADEQVLLAAVTPLLKEDLLQVVWAPHEPNPSHIKDLIQQLQSLGLRVRTLSEVTTDDPSAPYSVVLIDSVGHLAELYQCADFSFVGGSYKKRVHSVLEPLAAGSVVFTGPFIQNSPEALEFATIDTAEIGSMVMACPADALHGKLRRLVSLYRQNEDLRREHRQSILAEFDKRRHSSDKILEVILKGV
jgi:3-deoxy-D-manno-octulosonic-acid transferase